MRCAYPDFGHMRKSVARWWCPNCAMETGKPGSVLLLLSFLSCPPPKCERLWVAPGSCLTAHSDAALQFRTGNEGGCICRGSEASRQQLPAQELGQSSVPPRAAVGPDADGQGAGAVRLCLICGWGGGQQEKLEHKWEILFTVLFWFCLYLSALLVCDGSENGLGCLCVH